MKFHDDLVDRFEKAVERAEAAEARALELERVMRMVEYDDSGQCVWCNAPRMDNETGDPRPHAADCPRQRVLESGA